MRYQGRITNWKDDRGFGFISQNGGGEQVFVHVNSFLNRRRKPSGSEIVTYELETDAKGRMKASKVAFVGERPRSTPVRPQVSLAVLIPVAFLVFVTAAGFAGRLPLAVAGIYIATSALAFGAYAADKSAARSNEWRFRENHLHFLAMVGGWPGALVAQRVLRHKSSKDAFMTIFWVTVVLNCGALAWLLSPSGAATLNAFLISL